MKRYIAIIILAGFLLSAPAMAGVIDDAIDSLAESITKIYEDITKQRIVLYTACAAYHIRFNRWPANEEDLLAVEDAVVNEGKDKDALRVLVRDMEIVFTPAGGGPVLIKGRYKEEIEIKFQEIGIGKCLLSVTASAENDTIIFTPSDDTRDNKDFFNFPAKIKKKDKVRENSSGGEDGEPGRGPFSDLTSLKLKNGDSQFG